MKTEKHDLSERIERRPEMIPAHTKRGKTVRSVIEEFSVSIGTYYYRYHKYEADGIFGIFNSKKDHKTQHNKTCDKVASTVVGAADYHPELDAQEISKALEFSSGHKPSDSTVCTEDLAIEEDAEAKQLTDEERERVIRELYLLVIWPNYCCGLYAGKMLVIVHF